MIEFLSPISESLQLAIEELPYGSLGYQVKFYTEEGGLPDLSDVKIAILTIQESRSVEGDLIIPIDYDELRKGFYSLYPGNWETKIVDIGNIKKGENPRDTYFALQEIILHLIRKNIIPIILGQTQTIAYGQYRAFDNLDQMVNLVNIDYKFDIGNADLPISNQSYIGKIIVEKPYNLYNYSVVGYQSFFNPPEEINLMKKLFFDAYRLGEVTEDISMVEPILRDADMVIVDARAIKSSDMSFEFNYNPNGFDGREICALARYSGISNRVKSFGLYELGGEMSKISRNLVGQILWYFIEGVNFRVEENFSEESLFTTYIVPIEDMELIFKKSKKSERWWIEVSDFLSSGNKTEIPALLPCTYSDYLDACNQKIPERWLRSRLRNQGRI